MTLGRSQKSDEKKFLVVVAQQINLLIPPGISHHTEKA